MKELKTGYEWCLEANMRPLSLSMYNIPTSYEGAGFFENDFYAIPVSKEDFLEAIKDCEIKPNSTPRKTKMFLEYRMYGLVPYNISPIQAGIQYGHAVVEYQQMTRQIPGIEDVYNKWATQDKTFIILNGGTTNENRDSKWYGTLQAHRDILEVNDVLFAEFREPDLNNTLTAVVFLVDERVFNRELYPDYVNMPYPWEDKGRKYRPKDEEIAKWEEANQKNYEKWVEKIGGEKNVFLRTHLRGLKLANN